MRFQHSASPIHVVSQTLAGETGRCRPPCGLDGDFSRFAVSERVAACPFFRSGQHASSRPYPRLRRALLECRTHGCLRAENIVSTLSALISWLSTFSSNDLICQSFASSWAVSWLMRLFRASILSDSSLGNRACLSLAITWWSFNSSISRSARWSGVSPLSSVVLRVLFFGTFRSLVV